MYLLSVAIHSDETELSVIVVKMYPQGLGQKSTQFLDLCLRYETDDKPFRLK